jgi:hypothetical protein
MEDKKDFAMTAEANVPTGSSEADVPVGSADVQSTVIYIDPEKEKAALKKFDKWLVPVAFIFMVLSSLVRNNVSRHFHDCHVAADKIIRLEMPRLLVSPPISTSQVIDLATSPPY